VSFSERVTTVLSHPGWPFALVALLGAAGMYLLLPRGARGGRRVGGMLAVAAFVLLGAKLPHLTGLREGVFAMLATVTVVSAVGSVTFRSPVYCAIWFALTLAGTAGLFMFQGAQFLGVATIVVYAGAILVTMLFVLMLAQPQGLSTYDRVSWEPLLGAGVGGLLVGLLTHLLRSSLATADAGFAAAKPMTENAVLVNEHVAGLGAQLFSKHLIAVEAGGSLLLVAVVAAVAITSQGVPKRQGGRYE
jgi:NADH-quinone oxidoreductase subunit J